MGVSVAGPRGRLLQVLGLGFGLSVIVGNTIGAGILRTPGEIAGELPRAWWFFAVWVIGALYALLGTNSVAELGASVPRSGGQYVFSQRALGPYPGFIVGWSDWVSTCATTAAVSIAVGEAAARVWPALAGQELVAAFVVIAALTTIHWRGVLWGGRVQEVTSLLKALAFIALIVACFAWGHGRAAAPGPAGAVMAMAPFAAWIVALQAVIYTYDGWNGMVYFTEEVKDPGRDVPRAMFGGVLAVAAIYLLVNAAFLHVLSLPALAAAKLPAAAAARAVFGATGDLAVSAIMLISLLSAVNAYLMMAPRILYAMASDGLALGGATRVNRGGTPTLGLLVSAVAATLFLLGHAFETLIAVIAYFFVANYALSFVSLFVLRRREPDLPRPFRSWGYPWTNALALTGAVAFLVGAVIADPRHSLVALGLLALSYPVFRVARGVARRSGRQGEPGAG